jgi:hypothetical protein
MDFEAANKKFKEDLERLDNMLLMVLKNQIIVERFMIAFLDAHGKDPNHFFFTSKKIEGCSVIDPPEVGKANWNLLMLCSYVRNELAHSLDNDKLKIALDNVRNAYLTVTDSEVQKKSIQEMDDTQMVTSALCHCGSLIVIATENKIEADKKRKANAPS